VGAVKGQPFELVPEDLPKPAEDSHTGRMNDLSDAERRDRFQLAFDEHKRAMEQLPSATTNDQRLALWKTILTRQAEIEGLYPAVTDEEKELERTNRGD
jgi:hypothetical protein